MLKNLQSNDTMERDWVYQYDNAKVLARGSYIEDKQIELTNFTFSDHLI